jgi:hypothetical protein
VTVLVADRHIKAARLHGDNAISNHFRNPIALALQEMSPNGYARFTVVTRTRVHDTTGVYPLPPIAVNWLDHYDRAEGVLPFQFELYHP